MFGQVPRTPYDLQFTLLGIPVRVHPVFWLTSAFLAWEPNRLDAVFVRVLCVFVAILVHEMGHALVTRKFGWRPEVVLYFFGGYTTSMRHTTWRDVAVSAAGPASGFALYFLIWFVLPVLRRHGWLANELVVDAVVFSLFINLVWNLANLLPVIPLDGGQISRELFCWFSPRRGIPYSLMLSMLASGGVALWAVNCHLNGLPAFGLEPVFLAILFGYLCYQSYQQYEAQRRGYW